MSNHEPQNSDESDVETRRIRKTIWRRMLENSAFLVLIVNILLIVLFTIFSKNNVFISVENIEALLRNGTQILLISLGVTILMSAGIFDLSVGAILIMSSVLSALAIKWGVASGYPGYVSALIGLIVAVATGAAFGFVNGLIITKLRVNSLIATLGTLGIGSGMALLITGGQDIRSLPDFLQENFAFVKFGILPLPMLCVLLIMLGLWVLLRFTRFGMRTLAIGSNVTAAVRAGIQVDRHIIALTALAGALSGFAGLIDISRLGSTAISSHQLDGLAAVTAAVIGGTSLMGGRASIVGTLFGAALSVILLSGLIIIRVQPFWQLVATGVVLIAAVAFDEFRARQLDRRT